LKKGAVNEFWIFSKHIYISPLVHLKESPLRELKFIADAHLGKLTKYLRLCGYDTYYRTDIDDEEIIKQALSGKRVILTRDKEILKSKKVTHGFWIRSQHPRTQFKEVITHLDIRKPVALFTRCMECNGLLREVEKNEILDRLLPMTRRFYRRFKICDDCKRIYWNGSHYLNMKKEIKILFQDSMDMFL
jgi:uncharacterized protein with PIN domain